MSFFSFLEYKKCFWTTLQAKEKELEEARSTTSNKLLPSTQRPMTAATSPIEATTTEEEAAEFSTKVSLLNLAQTSSGEPQSSLDTKDVSTATSQSEYRQR